MRTREENLSILRNASGGIFSAGGPSGQREQEIPAQQNNSIRSRDESLRIIQNFPVILRSEATKNPVNRSKEQNHTGSFAYAQDDIKTFPVILNREAVKNPVSRTPAAENYSPMSSNDVGATLAVARPQGSPIGGAGVSPSTETKPMGYGGGGFSGGGGGRSGRAADNSGFSGTSGSFAKPESQTVQSGAAGQTRLEPSQPEKALTAADYDRLIREKEAELARWEEWDYDATSTRERQEYDNGIKAYENEIESLKAAKWKAEKEEQYGPLKNNADYETHSSATEEKPTAGFGIGWGTSWWGKGDPVYDYINDIDGTREKWNNPSTMGHSPYSIYDYMDEDEIKTYNYLYNTEGKEAAGKYLDYIEYALNDRSTKRIAQSAAEMADKHPVVSSAASIPTNLVSGIGLADVAWQNLKRELNGEYVPIDYNRGAMAPSVMTSAIRGTVAQNIADSTGVITLDEEEHPYLSKIFNGKSLGDVYQLGMSMADSLTVAYLTPLGKYGAVLLGGSAGTQGVLDALERGATDEQALKMGLLNGTFEALFEYVSLDKLLTSEPKNLIRALLKQGGVEASEEFMTTFANNIADILVMAEKSDYRLKIQAYMESGMSREEAAKQALLDKCIELGWDAAGGFFSGGISGSISTKVSGINSRRGTQIQGQTQSQTQAPTQAQAKGMTAALQDQAPQLTAKTESSAASPAVKPLNTGQQTGETEQYIAALRNPGESDTINEKDRRISLALELAAQGKTPSQIYQETGLVTKANGDIMDGFDGEVIWRNNGQEGISDRNTAGSKTEGTTQTEISGDDGRGDVGRLLPQSGRTPYASLTEQQRDRARETIIRCLEETDSDEALDLLEEFGDDAELAQRIYNDYAAGDAALERWAEFFDDTEGLSRELDEISSPGDLQNDAHLEKGAPLGGAGTYSVSEGGTTAAAETAAETDPAAAALQQQYQTEIAAALWAGDYQLALKLFKEYGNPNLRALNDLQTQMYFEDFFQSAGLDETDKLKQFGDSYGKAGDEPYSSDRIEKDISDLLETDISQVCLGNIPQESKQVIYNGVERCIRKFPKIKEQLRSIVYDPNIKPVAKSHSINGIIVVGKNFSDLKKLKKMYDYNVQHNFYPKGTNVNSIIIHEIGHQFDGLFSLNGIAGGGIGEFGIIRRSSTNIQKEILSRLGLTDEKLKAIHQEYASKGYTGQELDRIVLLRKKEFITQHVSEYASNNEREFFAELFSEYMTSDCPRKAAQVFGDIFEREYGGLD